MKFSILFQANLQSPARVSGILIQGRGDRFNQYVKTFTLAVSDNGAGFVYVTSDGSTSPNAADAFEFTGNSDTQTVIEVRLPQPIETTYVRLYPQTYNSHISMRWDILRCDDGQWELTRLICFIFRESWSK